MASRIAGSLYEHTKQGGTVPQQNDTPTCYASALSPTRLVKVHRHLV